jgi:UDP-N-acetylmuramoyl-L-alanyl-D-glutamate--2,6-diaminopimelate ligase
MSSSLDTWLAPFGIKADAAQVKDVKSDSRDICPGDVFLAFKGLSQNGVAYIDNAVANGAVAVLIDRKDVEQVDKTADVQVVAVDELLAKLPQLLSAFYHDSKQIKKIGVTGTNGKTTISQLVAQLADKVGQKTSVIGTLGAGTLSSLVDINNTTPGLANNYRLLSQFAQNGSRFAAMEVSSQGLAQNRVSGIDFDWVVFTNLTQDHLDYHGTLNNYTNAKKRLFDTNKSATAVLNIDDPVGASWFNQWQTSRKLIAAGGFDESYTAGEYVMYSDVRCTHQGLAFTLHSSWGEAKIVSPLFGLFNLNNLVTAMAVLLSAGIALAQLVEVVKQIEAVPGRMEKFSDGGVVAIVDYAHTPDALSQALQALKGHVKGQLWCIFGCGGDRDKSKRPLMGRMAESFADQIIVTNDNPRSEAPQQIVEDIQAGFTPRAKVVVELDRKRAIFETLSSAKADDMVLIAGKGHETYQIIGDYVIDYDERLYVSQCFSKLTDSHPETPLLRKRCKRP